MTSQMKTASLAGLAGSVVSKGVTPQSYQNSQSTAKEIAASIIIAERFSLPPHIARLVCELAHLGRAV